MVDKSASADLRATKMLIDMMKEVEHKAGIAAPPPEPRRLAEADDEVMQNLVVRLRRQILWEIEEAKTAELPEQPSRSRSTRTARSVKARRSNSRRILRVADDPSCHCRLILRVENMTRTLLWAGMIAAFGLVSTAHAADIRVLASVALTAALDDLAPVYEKKTGNKLSLGYGLSAELKKRVSDGEAADLIILTRPMMEDLQHQGKVAAGSLVNLAGTPVAVVARAGAPKPDISSVDALKRTLLAARSIVYSDPAKGGLSGVYFAKVLDRLGIADQVKDKTILVPGPQAPEVVAKGDAELGVAQASEIVPVAGTQLVGPLPGELASMTLFTGGIGAASKSPEATKTLIQFLIGPEAMPRMKTKGFESAPTG